MNYIEREAMDFWRQEWGEIPDGPLYGKGDTLEERWESLSDYDRNYYISYVESELKENE